MQEKLQEENNKVLTNNINAIRAILASVKGTLGPQGLDVMLVDEFGNFNCSNDGVEILSNIKIAHPAAKLAVQAIKAQEREVGDGTSTASLIIDSILETAQLKMEAGANPIQIAKGLTLGLEHLNQEFKNSSKKIKDINDPKLAQLVEIAARGDKELAKLIIEAAKKSQDKDLSNSIIARLGQEEQVLEGLFIKKKSHFSYTKDFKNPAILIVEGPLEPEPISSEAISTDEGVKKFEYNVQSMLELAKKIAKADIKAVFTSSSIFPSVEELLVKEGVFVLSHLTANTIEKLQDISNAKTTTRSRLINADLNSINKFTGKLKSIQIKKDLGGFLLEANHKQQASILISAETEAVLEERQRIAVDASLALVTALETGYLIGGGIAELNLVSSLENLYKDTEDSSIADGIEILADTLPALSRQIIKNAGWNYQEKLQAISAGPNNSMGINLDTGAPINYEEAGIIDVLGTKLSAYRVAVELSIQILRINMILESS